jgi:hypothetical protein
MKPASPAESVYMMVSVILQIYTIAWLMSQ